MLGNRITQVLSFGAFIAFSVMATTALAKEAGRGNDVIATVNGKPVQRALADAMASEQPAASQSVEEQQAFILNRLIGNELFIQEALKRRLDKDPGVVTKIEMLRRDVLANAYAQLWLDEHPIPEDAVGKEYERHKALLAGTKEYNVRHILAADEASAQALIVRLNKGADFAGLAKEMSLDQGGSKNLGGNLGWISVDNSDRILYDAVAKLGKGRHSKVPVQTRYGWHVLQVDDVRDVEILSYESVRERVLQQLRQEKLRQLERDLRESAVVAMPEKR